jgi:hypothetical protein
VNSARRTTFAAMWPNVSLGVLDLDDGFAGEWVDLLFRVQHEICGSNERIGQINEIIQDAEVWPSSRVWQIR